MKILFIHQNFPGQYLHLARHLGTQPEHEVIFITQRSDATLPGIKNIVYKPHREINQNQHHYLTDTEAGLLNAQAVARVALDLKVAGFTPDVMLGHNGWGETWYLKDVFPNTPLISYFEFFYRYLGADVGFDPAELPIFDTAPRIRTKNMGNLIGLDASDMGQTPTQWQRSLYPAEYQHKLYVTHEGIDTEIVKPDPNARLCLPEAGFDLTRDDEVLTYVARNLEPYRGFPIFMRSLPAILEQRPNARVLIVGGDEVSYGHRLPDGQTHRQRIQAELGSSLDMKRVHFLGKVPYSFFLKILQVSRVHVYLTYPFVLSWSMLEAMSAGCLVVGSKTAPVEEMIRDGENGFLVDFFSPAELSEHVIDALAAGRNGYADIRQNARRTILEKFDLRTICLPAQLQLIEIAMKAR